MVAGSNAGIATGCLVVVIALGSAGKMPAGQPLGRRRYSRGTLNKDTGPGSRAGSWAWGGRGKSISHGATQRSRTESPIR
jgi:hypothetical protein